VWQWHLPERFEHPEPSLLEGLELLLLLLLLLEALPVPVL
jgi:hypothetical protein